MKLPFRDPDYDLNLNIGLLLIIISQLSKTKRGKPTLNNDRLHIYLCLIKNPSILNRVMEFSGGTYVQLNENDAYSITTIAPSLDTLFDSESLKSLLIVLISKNLVHVEYKANEGFCYFPTISGQEISEQFCGEYFSDIKRFCAAMNSLQSKSISKLNVFINKALRVE